MASSTNPAANRACICVLPAAAVPISSAISDAMVSPLPNSSGNRFALPTTIMTAMVSPMARANAIMTDGHSSRSDTGSTTAYTPYHFPTPRFSDAAK